MPQNTIITLLTDFGESDVYVGVMKGVIAQINPGLTVVDLTHQIPPQNIAAARFSLMNAFPYFPKETVHIAVVDPGVGSERRGIALQLDAGFLVGPDNGLFTGVLNQNPVIVAVELTNPQYWRTPTPSNTFHGRDIFAAAGAHLASGIAIEQWEKSLTPKPWFN
jgi:S-adenosylmethionine hydrolase